MRPVQRLADQNLIIAQESLKNQKQKKSPNLPVQDNEITFGGGLEKTFRVKFQCAMIKLNAVWFAYEVTF